MFLCNYISLCHSFWNRSNLFPTSSLSFHFHKRKELKTLKHSLKTPGNLSRTQTTNESKKKKKSNEGKKWIFLLKIKYVQIWMCVFATISTLKIYIKYGQYIKSLSSELLKFSQAAESLRIKICPWEESQTEC